MIPATDKKRHSACSAIRLGSVVSASIFSYTPIIAQEAAPVTLPPVSVQANFSNPQRQDLLPDSVTNLARVSPSSEPHTQTFTRNEIADLKPSNVYDLLNQATGVITTYQGRKLPFNVFIRGDNNFGFIVDGAYVPLATAGRVLQTLPIDAIEQVTIVRDATALTLGPAVDLDSASGALNSGFIVINTHRPTRTEAIGRTSFSSYGTLTSSGYAGSVFTGGLNQPSAYISGLSSYQRSDGPGGYNMWSNALTGMLKGGVSAGVMQTDVMFYSDTSRYGFERALTGQSTSALAAQNWSYSPIDTTLIALNSTFSWDQHNTTLINFAYNTVTASNVQASYTSAAISENYDKTYETSVSLRHSFQYGGSLLQIGGQYVGYNTPTGELFYSGYADNEQTLSTYVNGEQKLLNNNLTLDASARLDSHEIIQGIDLYNEGNGNGNNATATASTSSASSSASSTSSKTSTTSTTSSKNGAGSGSGSGSAQYNYFYGRAEPLAINYAFGASYKVLPQLVASARFNHTEQGGLQNILSATGVPLNPERQNKWEVGIEAPVSPQFTPILTFFDTSIENDKTPTSYQTINGFQTPLWSESNTHRQGFELVVKGQLPYREWLAHWFGEAAGQTNYHVGYTHLTEVSSSTLPVYTGTIPKDLADFSLTQGYEAWSGTVLLKYVSTYFSNFNSADGNYHPVGNFVTIDLRLGRSFDLGWSKLDVSAFGRNITDRKYETVYGYPSWGAVYGSELRVQF